MKKRNLLLLAIAWMGMGQAWADSGWLVSPEEMEKEIAYAGTLPDTLPQTKAISPGAPEIVLVEPSDLSRPLSKPFPISLAFKANDGAAVKPETFKALYGMLKLDITDRITKKAKVSPEGIVVEKAEIPSGDHRLILRVTDDQGRRGEAELKFTVRE